MFKRLLFKKCNRSKKSGYTWQNLPELILIILLVFGLSNTQLFAFSKKRPLVKHEFDRQIRVWLGSCDSLNINSSGEMILECFRNGQRAEIYYTSSTIDFEKTKKGITIKDNNGILAMNLSSVLCRPRFPNVFLDFDNKRYRGIIECDNDKNNKKLSNQIRVFNLIDIELYLKGVLPGEIGDRSKDEFEAVKAQAIAARTYAIWRLADESDDRHLKNSIDDQLYLGASSELPLLNKAVEQTEGVIMTYDNKPIAAYYHAVCGGSTTPIEKVWDSKKVKYLKGTVDGDYCQWAKTFFWNEEFSSDYLTKQLSQYFSRKGSLPKKGFGKIQSIIFKKDNSIGRMAELKVITSTGKFSVKSDQIRWALKRPSVPGTILPSTRFNAKTNKSKGSIKSIELVGAGNGHGIGMCQCGAIGRARAGASFEEILHTYYKGVKIEKIY